DDTELGVAFVVEAQLAGTLDVELAFRLLAARAELGEAAHHRAHVGKVVGDLLSHLRRILSLSRSRSEEPHGADCQPDEGPSGAGARCAEIFTQFSHLLPLGPRERGRSFTFFLRRTLSVRSNAVLQEGL